MSDVFVQLVELNENESIESGEDDSCEKIGDLNPCPHRSFDSTSAAYAEKHPSAPNAHLAKNNRETVSTPPPERD